MSSLLRMPSGAPPPSGLPTIDPPLTPGAKSVSVARLQELLTAMGYSPGPIDGMAGPQLLLAVDRAFRNLSASPSLSVRQLVLASPDGLSVGQVLEQLVKAFQIHAGVTGAELPIRPDAPPTEIRMGPREAARLERQVGLRHARPIGQGHTLLVGGAILAGVATLALAFWWEK